MSSEDQPAPEAQPSQRCEASQQNAHWREIGLPALAAAAPYNAAKQTVSDAPGTGAARTDEAKIVTIRDVEYFAA